MFTPDEWRAGAHARFVRSHRRATPHAVPMPPWSPATARVAFSLWVCAVMTLLGGCRSVHARDAQPAVTSVYLENRSMRTGVKRFGINLSGQTFYDSGQMLNNLVSRNPGFEGETWRSILRCKTVTADTCTEDNQYTQWPEGFLKGGHFEVISGPAHMVTGDLAGSSAAHPPLGVTLKFAAPVPSLRAGDFVLVREEKPGDADAGWWKDLAGGATLATEFRDLPPRTEGKQALRFEASAPGQVATIHSYFDSLEGHSFVQLHGSYLVQFVAKGLAPGASLKVHLERLDLVHGITTFLDRDVKLTSEWHPYAFDFAASEHGQAVGTVGLSFSVRQSSALLDDVALTPARQPSNRTAFRDEVEAALRELRPGVLRYMDNGTDFGSSLDNMLAPAFGRERAGYSTQSVLQEDIPIGLHEFLTLAEAVGAEPWYTLPATTSPAEAAELIEYLSGPVSSVYGKRRATLGQTTPWTDVFPVIHLELGNEMWNARSFAGGSMADPVAYAARAKDVFSSMRSAPGFNSAHFDLVLGAWAAVPWWTGQELSVDSGANTVAFAPYLFSEFNDASSPEAVFGPMFAEPEQLSARPDGEMAAQANAARKAAHPAQLAVYETNLGTMSGSVSQHALDEAIPSWGGGLAVADHMLLMLRELGITTQALFCLPEFRNDFTSTGNAASQARKTTPLWGAVVDMGGATNRRRPAYLALEQMNRAILPEMLASEIKGPNPTWNQLLSSNDKVHLEGAHDLQSFAFAGGRRRSLILLNLSRTVSRDVLLDGPNAPVGRVERTLLTAAAITDSNESAELVKSRDLPALKLPAQDLPVHQPLTLPPFSMTILRWNSGAP